MSRGLFTVFHLACLALAALTLAGCVAPTPEQRRAAFKEDLRAALKEDPDLVLATLGERKAELYNLVIAGSTQHQMQAWEARVQDRLKDPLHPDLAADRPWWGNPQAPVTVVEYLDFLCSACAQGAINLKQVLARHPGQIRVLVKHLPSSELSWQMATYFEALGRQDPALAWKFYELAFRPLAEGREMDPEALKEMVAGLGADSARLARDLADPVLAQRITQDGAEAKALGLVGTPNYVVQGLPVEGAAPPEMFERAISLWQQAQGPPGQ